MAEVPSHKKRKVDTKKLIAQIKSCDIEIEETPAETTKATPVSSSNFWGQKQLVQAMFDVALLLSNWKQLFQLLHAAEGSTAPVSLFHKSAIVLFIVSITFQVAVGVGLIVLRFYVPAAKREDGAKPGLRKNLNFGVTLLIFFIMVINILAAAFSPHLALADKDAIIDGTEVLDIIGIGVNKNKV